MFSFALRVLVLKLFLDLPGAGKRGIVGAISGAFG